MKKGFLIYFMMCNIIYKKIYMCHKLVLYREVKRAELEFLFVNKCMPKSARTQSILYNSTSFNLTPSNLYLNSIISWNSRCRGISHSHWTLLLDSKHVGFSLSYQTNNNQSPSNNFSRFYAIQ